MQQTRDTQLDAYRAIVMMYIVTIVHCVFYLNMFINNATRSWLLVEMPAIFFIAGASFKLSQNANSKRSYYRYILSRIKRTIAPYCIWAVVCIISIGTASFLLRNVEHHANTMWSHYTSASNYLPLLQCKCSNLIPYSFHVWFIPVYLYVCCLAPFLYRVYKSGIKALILLQAALIILQIILDISHSSHVTVKYMTTYAFFFSMGFYYKDSISKKLCTTVAICSLALCIILYSLGLYGCDMQVTSSRPT